MRRQRNQNPMYRRIKIRGLGMCYIKPRVAIPASGKPVLYTCEGAENWTGPPKSLCAGQVIDFAKLNNELCGQWTVLAVVWIGCVKRCIGRGGNRQVQYNCSGPALRILMCPLKTFDDAKNIGEIETSLRFVLNACSLLFRTNSLIHIICLQVDGGW